MKELFKQILREESIEYISQHYPSIRILANASEKELQQIPYVGASKAKELKTIFDISKRLLEPEIELKSIRSPDDVYQLMKIMCTYEEERVCCILLDIKNKIIDQLCVSKGSLSETTLQPREVFTAAVRLKAAGIILVHNHPSNVATPSVDDIEITRRINNAGEVLGIKVLDHIIITNKGFTSLKEEGVI